MDLKIKSAIVGCGRMGAFTSESVDRFAPRCWFPLSHAQAIELHPRLALAALCDTNAESLRRAAEVYGISRTYDDFRRLIDEEKPQLMGIATRTLGRADIVRRASEAGVRALHIEKPLCNSMQELAMLTQRLARDDLFCTYGTIRRHFKIYQAARELADSGLYGALREIRVNMGSGMLYWTHPHSVDLILFAAGERPVQAVQARLAGVAQGSSAVEVASDPYIDSASIYFADGVSGHITRGSGYALILSCADGEITVENDGQGISIATRRADSPYFCASPHGGAFSAAGPEGSLAPISHLVRCIEGDAGEILLNARLKAQILQGQRILFAMVQSHIEQSRLVGLGDIDPRMTVLAKTGDKFA